MGECAKAFEASCSARIVPLTDSCTPDHAANLRALAHSIVRLVAGLALPPVTSEEKEEDDALDQVSNGERDRRRALALCVLNEDGALTWKEGCEGRS